MLPAKGSRSPFPVPPEPDSAEDPHRLDTTPILVPLYLQLKHCITGRIESGSRGAGSRIPSEKFGIARMIASHALKEQAYGRRFVEIQGPGRFVVVRMAEPMLVEGRPPDSHATMRCESLTASGSAGSDTFPLEPPPLRVRLQLLCMANS